MKHSPLIIESKDLKTAIEKTLFSTADGAIRPVLAGIYLKPTEDALIFASTDSFRLSELRVTTPGISSSAVIVPKKAAQELARIVSDEDDSKKIELYFHENQLLAVRGNIRLSSRLLS